MKVEKNQIIEYLNSALAETFEGLAFLEFDQWELIQHIPLSMNVQYISSIEITHPFNSKISLVCGEKVIINTIESITGDEFNKDESVISDTLKEILNTFCGRFMVNVLPDGIEFDFGIPDFAQFDNNDFKINDSDIVIKFDYDEDSVFCIYSENRVESK